MKTSENISYFRSSIIEKLDDIIEEIDRKHTRYIRNAVMRAKFLLSTGNNLEGKLSKILHYLAEEINRRETEDFTEETWEGLRNIYALYPQNYISPESLRTMPVTRKTGVIDRPSEGSRMTEEDSRL